MRRAGARRKRRRRHDRRNAAAGGNRPVPGGSRTRNILACPLLGRDNDAYNPLGYHLGTVWPHDNALIAAGMWRYGFADGANQVFTALYEAALQFPYYRLPELFCGIARTAYGVPIGYPVACSPQAWAAGAPFLFLQTMLGLQPHADRGELELFRPNLPDWLGKVTLTNLRVGDAAVDLLFHRWRGTTSAEVLRKVGDISVTIRL